MIDPKFILFRGLVIRLDQGEDRLWRSFDGCVFALTDKKATVDDINRCGIGFFSLPTNHPLTAACKVNDYEGPTYQLYHSRQEADWHLRKLIAEYGKTNWYGLLAKPFYWAARYWKEKSTR